ncbi:MAG: N-acetyltransferase [Chloroflexi bacterium]|nr:N-acetyltransferase [Chloroflexota bacterium]
MFAVLGEDCVVQDNVVLGLEYAEGCKEAVIGRRAVIRWGTVIYADVQIGDDFKTGHSALIRENTIIGNQVVIGTNTVIDGTVDIGSFVKLESNVYIPTHTRIGDYVFIGPGAVLTNDKYPQRLRDEYEPQGPVIEDNVTIGANATVLPAVHIGEGAMIAAGAIVTKDVPPWHMAIGSPARSQPLPERLKQPNRAKQW